MIFFKIKDDLHDKIKIFVKNQGLKVQKQVFLPCIAPKMLKFHLFWLILLN